MNKELRLNEGSMNNELKRALKELNETIGKIDLNLFKNFGELTNLKLHQVYHMSYDMEDFEGIFAEFCMSEYEHFEEILNASNLVKTHIGSTSSFYLEHEHFELFETNYQSDFEGKSPLDKLEMVLFNEIAHWFDVSDFKMFALSVIEVNTDFVNHEDIDFLRHEIEGTMEILADIDRIYKFIEDYKKNQCQHFMKFIDFN